VIHDFGFEIPGQPPSTNRIYELAYRYDGRGNRYAGGRVKIKEVEEYQVRATRLCERAKPALWEPRAPYRPKKGTGLIVVELAFFLARDIDCDNAQKVLLDGIKFGLGTRVVISKTTKRPRLVPVYDDSRFLGRAMFKQTGVKEPRVKVTILG
jgi:hypothetical protein